MEEISTLRTNLQVAVSIRLARFWKASIFVKIALLALASALIAVAQLAQVPAGQQINSWQIAGILASFVVAVGATFIAITETDSSKELAVAAEAIEQTQAIKDSYDGLRFIFGNLERTIELYRATMVMRGGIETMISSGIVDDVLAAETLLQISSRSLAIAMDFAQSDQWTICVFKAIVAENGRVKLKCVAHSRAIACEIEKARQWEEGVGVAGVSYSNAGEVIIPDMFADGLRTVFASQRAETRDYDDERYRSMAAMPIEVDGMEKPWGVVVCTSDQPGHFDPDGTTGAKTHEGGRALSGMIALAVAAIRRNQSSP